MTIKYLMNNLNSILKITGSECVLDVYILRRKKHIQIAFDRPLMSLENTEEILVLTKYGDQFIYGIIFPRLIHGIDGDITI